MRRGLGLLKKKDLLGAKKPYTGVEMLYFPKSNTVYVQWRKNGLIHKLDGPAAEEGYFINNEEIRLVNQVYCYNSEYCFVYLNTDRVIKEAESLGRLVLDHEKLSDNIYLFKLLAADKLEERYCWIIDGV